MFRPSSVHRPVQESINGEDAVRIQAIDKEGKLAIDEIFVPRPHARERGYVLIAAIALAILYFALMELMLIDSSRALREAQRFRSKVIATTLAESAAELSAASMVTHMPETTSTPTMSRDR